MSEKRQTPLWLDMDFAEALARFGLTDRKETLEGEAATASKKAAGVSIPPPDKPVVNSKKRGRPRKSPA